MKKQKICVIGGSLAGLVTAISLSKLNCEIDLVIDNPIQNLKSTKNYWVIEKLAEIIMNSQLLEM